MEACEASRKKSAGMRKEGPKLRFVTVYRVDPKTMGKESVGVLIERRKEERGDDVIGRLRLARMKFAATEKEARRIFTSEYLFVR